MRKRKVILRLIKDHIVFTRVIDGLGRLGFQNEYGLCSGDTIFELMDVEHEDDLYEEFLDWCQEAARSDIFKYPRYLDSAAESIYRLLKQEIQYLEYAKHKKKHSL